MAILEETIRGLDVGQCNRRLTQRLQESLEKARMDYSDLSSITGIDFPRLESIMKSEIPVLSKEELKALSFVSGTGLDYIFCLPNIDDDNIVRKEYAEYNSNDPLKGELYFAGPANSSDTAAMRALLIHRYITRCLDKYE